MAGIGFVLRKLMKKEDLSGLLQAYFHATLASCGAWLFTVIALSSFFFVFQNWSPVEDVENFRGIILYNFSFSLVFASPISFLATRHLADCIYEKKLNEIIGMLLGALITLFALTFPLVGLFYFFYATLSLVTSWLAVVNFLITAAIWVIIVFVSATRHYKTVTFSFLLGLLISVATSVFLGALYSIEGMLVGFNVGMGFLICSLLAAIFAQYPPQCGHLFNFLKYAKKYWKLALGGLCYNLAIWIDKWIMWLSPQSEVLSSGLTIYPTYDTAMFAAYLTTVPGMAMFLLTQETTFFEVYIKFYQDIQEHVSLKKIRFNHQEIVDAILYSGRSILLLQLIICITTLLLAPHLFDFFGINFVKLGIFRYGTLGATFQVLIIYLSVLLSYFDYRKGALWIQLIFLLTNALFTLLTLQLGFPFYGYGFFLSTLITFIVAAVIAGRYVNNLPYHAFITTNASVADS